jgi:hypothetical protein
MGLVTEKVQKMFNPSERINDGSPKPKPKMVVGISFNPKEKINDSTDEGSGEEKDPRQVMDEACAGICKTLNVSPSAAPRLCQYLEAFFNAADSMPHKEGEHEGEESDEGTEEEGME